MSKNETDSHAFFMPSSGNKKSTNKNIKRTDVVINRMYVGDYLLSNLGHEIINLFQADNKNFYLYLNASGSVEYDTIGYMLLVRNHSHNKFEVIGLAKKLEKVSGADIHQPKSQKEKNRQEIKKKEIIKSQKKYIRDENIRYAGVPLLEIFKDAEQQNVYVTFKTEKMYVPKTGTRIFIQYDGSVESFNTNWTTVVLTGYKQPKTSLRSYIWEMPGDGENAEEKRMDYQNVMERLIHNDSLWEPAPDWKERIPEIEQVDVSLFDICRIQDDENRLSNVMAYFMVQEKYRNLWRSFFKDENIFKCPISLSNSYLVERERSSKIENIKYTGGRIDVWIDDPISRQMVIIENKIKSDINTVKADKLLGEHFNQLDRYVHYADSLIAGEGIDVKKKYNSFQDYTPHYVLLTPNYNVPSLITDKQKLFQIVTFRQLYEFLKKHREVFAGDHNFTAFFRTIKRHTYPTESGYLYDEMLQTFMHRLIIANNDNRKK